MSPAVVAALLIACAPEPAPPPALRPAPRPLPVTGGTLVALDDHTVVAADPEGAQLLVVDLTDGFALADTILLPAGSQPGRAVVGAPGELWVVLRAAGAVARVEGRQVSVHPVCDDPRGVTRGQDGSLWVACADGGLVHLDDRGAWLGRVELEPDLRDVIAVGDDLWVSRFRAAEVLVVRDGVVTGLLTPPVTAGAHPAAAMAPSVAWRMIPTPDGALLAHQRAQDAPISLASDAAFGSPPYGGPGCDAVVQAGLTRFFADGRPPVTLGPLQKAVLPVDVTLRDDGTAVLVAAGAGGLSDVAAGFADPALWGHTDACTMLPGLSWSGATGAVEGGGRVVAALSTPQGLVLQTQSPLSMLWAPAGGVTDRIVVDDVADRGVELTHLAPTASVACASCHPEGTEDGRVWSFTRDGVTFPRRTQTLAGVDLGGTAPLHWDGDLADVTALLHDTYERRIGGVVRPGDDEALTALLAPVRPATTPFDPALAARGALTFDAAGCASCHAGPELTDNLNHDVGTDDPSGPVSLQTPSLVGVGARGPWMHDGCAATLEARFDPACGGTAHGDVAAEEIPGLVAFLRSL